MSWLRIDDRFSRHPKVTALSFKDRWTWMDVLCFCATYRTDGWLPANVREMVPGASAKFLAACADLELLDVEHGEYRVHDWSTYAPKDPTAAERQAAWRRKRNASSNGSVTEDVTDESSTSRVGARARSRPVPSSPSPKAVTELQDEAERPSDFKIPELRSVS